MTAGLAQYKREKFDELTTALKEALRRIRADPRLPLTVEQVADMASCSRQLLYTPKREWVARRIKRIRLSRSLAEKKAVEAKPARNEVSNVDATDALKKMRHDNAELFHANLALEKELSTVRDENKQLSRDLKSCEEQLYELREKVRLMSTSNSFRRRSTNR
ncbi:hypothetical protein [Paraburkholderia fungorum]|uniref:hypothetical protein n=1 Tax=Paraburkholderia fungorum TaxID=134537 RepID=UPI002093D1AB|nr:hypothetical protein [Paraburkholderia fungorum]USU18812.1 hypothetical protein NFE55_32165 [Paraburkholderia fungorum]USU29192.1 hypothetical protein NFS19_29405 [Paraburkholderia fungorum]